VATVFALVMAYTVYGRNMYAIGANPVAARLCGIRIRTVVFGGFVLTGACVALGGLIIASQVGSATPTAASGLELSVITAIVLGGASLTGGRGSVVGAVLGTLIFGVLRNALPQIPGATFYDRLIVGVVVVVIVVVDQFIARKGA
jgi:ribose transport system permease protein